MVCGVTYTHHTFTPLIKHPVQGTHQALPSKTTHSRISHRTFFLITPLLLPQIEEYMDQLPNHKVPRVGTPGERYRDLQLIRQLPKQDLSDRYCKALEDPSEIKEFRIFRELRDQVAMDIGAVKEAPTDTVRGWMWVWALWWVGEGFGVGG